MIFILSVSILWGVFISFFVLSPLLGAHKKQILKSMKENKNQLDLLEQEKTFLIQKIVTGQTSHEKINSFNEEDCYSALYKICEEIESYGVLWNHNLNSIAFEKKQSGHSTIQFLFSLFAIFLIAFSLISNRIFANELESQNIPANVTVPPPFILPNTGYWLPAVNQFILIPSQGKLVVYYVGMFSNTFHAKGTKILLPFPKNVTNVTIQSKDAATLETMSSENHNEIILNTPLDDSVNQIQAEFTLDAKTNTIQWKANSLPTLPGVTIVMMNEEDGKFLNFPKDFYSLKKDDLTKAHLQASELNTNSAKQFVRLGDSNSTFPEFEIQIFTPSRFFIHLIIAFFSCFFIAAILFCLKISKKSVF
jgi:hypothetical protein